uniref:Uncharacterized protein n=1 Tax=Physcomitrium patens TaxID=3218 RepID=A0A2K1LB37_PHYPA|nr:hypothetical protein PHYPA_001664 [Physcomitrium patens]
MLNKFITFLLTTHMDAVKRILYYLRETTSCKIFFLHNYDLNVQAFANSN